MQLKLDASVKESLERTRADLESEREKAATKIVELQMKMKVAKEGIAAIDRLLGTRSMTHASLANAIRQVVKEAGRPVEPAYVTEILKSQRFEVGGKTDIAARVSSEMYRMSSKGHFDKVEGGYQLTANADDFDEAQLS